MFVGVYLADYLVRDVLGRRLPGLTCPGLGLVVFGLRSSILVIWSFIGLTLFGVRLFDIPLFELDVLELVNRLKFLHGVTQVLDDLALLLVEDGQHKVHAGQEGYLHCLLD